MKIELYARLAERKCKHASRSFTKIIFLINVPNVPNKNVFTYMSVDVIFLNNCKLLLFNCTQQQFAVLIVRAGIKLFFKSK